MCILRVYIAYIGLWRSGGWWLECMYWNSDNAMSPPSYICNLYIEGDCICIGACQNTCICWSKEAPPPGVVSYLLCSLIKKPKEEEPLRRICTRCFEEDFLVWGPLTLDPWLGDIANRKPPVLRPSLIGRGWCLMDPSLPHSAPH